MQRSAKRVKKHDAPGKEAGGHPGMLRQAVENHVESFNTLIERGLDHIVDRVNRCVVDLKDEPYPTLEVALTELNLSPPTFPEGDRCTRKWVPSDCRMGGTTYNGALSGNFVLRLGDDPQSVNAQIPLGRIPIMVRSSMCNLHGLGPKELVYNREDETESGGYFITNGLERVVRMLIVPRGNFPMAISRGAFKKRGPLYTESATVMRCIRPDNSTMTNTLHYCKDGSCFFRFLHYRQEWLVPLVLAAQVIYPVTDRALVEMLAGGGAAEAVTHDKKACDAREAVLMMLQQVQASHPYDGHKGARRYFGSQFRVVVGDMIPRSYTDEDVTAFIIKRFFFVHTESPWLKLQSLCVMFHKLVGLVNGEVAPENQDAFCYHDVLHAGQTYGIVLKESLDGMMKRLKIYIMKMLKKNEDGKSKYSVQNFRESSTRLETAVKAVSDVQKRMENFLATGNVKSEYGVDLSQASGFTVVADKLNQARFSSHFAAIHRGQYFAQMRTTTVRKLLPETWGFLCPVHTPDGEPCGLLNHIANAARTVVKWPTEEETEAVAAALAQIGIQVSKPGGGQGGKEGKEGKEGKAGKLAWITLDGLPLAQVDVGKLTYIDTQLRRRKVAGKNNFPKDLEIVCVTRKHGCLFPGMFLFLGPGRMIRPVRSLRTGAIEWIGPLEQLFLNIAVLDNERDEAREALERGKTGKSEEVEVPEQLPLAYTHQELQPTSALSLLASLTPFSNHNQSPRNMYQCQMLKQTMGTPYHNHPFRFDNRIYRVYFPQKPIVRTETYSRNDCDLHPTGTNAVVAVITYSGYDIEDAMVINKMSFERGFGHGVVYKTKIIDAASKGMPLDEQLECQFKNVVKGRDGTMKVHCPSLDDRGLPRVNAWLENGEPLCCVIDHKGMPNITKYHEEAGAYVESVTLIDSNPTRTGLLQSQRVMIRLRYPRRPDIGDKFSSRHGQKGVMSILWRQEDMPFTDGGVTPDILFNPHGFPSRMTIGMLIESIAAKTAAMEGKPTVDGSTFRKYSGLYGAGDNNESDPFLQQGGKKQQGKVQASEYFGTTLAKNGFQRLGTERMYSGIHGTEIETEIFVGIVYYQRLRHMVADKVQVRARGPLDKVTHQPVKGRKRHGGIRFGEMERDSLIAHGTSYLLHDRLMRCSDYDVGYVCPECGSILTPQANAQARARKRGNHYVQEGETWECPPCSLKLSRPVKCKPMPIPWVYRYLTCEMAAINVNWQIRVKDLAREASMTTLEHNEDVSMGTNEARGHDAGRVKALKNKKA